MPTNLNDCRASEQEAGRAGRKEKRHRDGQDYARGLPQEQLAALGAIFERVNLPMRVKLQLKASSDGRPGGARNVER
jgi:hypothetical protein